MTEFEPLVDGAVQLRLAAHQHVAQPLDAHGGVRLQSRKLDHLTIGRSSVAPAQHLHGDKGRQRRQERARNNRDSQRKKRVWSIIRGTLARFVIRTKREPKINGLAAS